MANSRKRANTTKSSADSIDFNALLLHDLRWVLVVSTIWVLGIGSIVSTLLIVSILGHLVWLGTIVLAAVLGALALLLAGRGPDALRYLVYSPMINFCWWWMQVVLCLLEPVLTVPSLILLIATYMWGAWRFVLSSGASQATVRATTPPPPPQTGRKGN